MKPLLLLVPLSLMLSGCTPAVYIEIYNGTGDVITVSTDSFPKAIAVAPNISAKLPLIYSQGQHLERLFVRTSHASWFYYFKSFHIPESSWKHGTLGTMRVYTILDSTRRIFLLTPPDGGAIPQRAQQPHGFPVSPAGKI
jgi:hypothetical protein